MTDNGLLALRSENFEIKIRRACKNEVECFPAEIRLSGFKGRTNHLIVFLIFAIDNEFVDHFLVSGLEGGVGIVCEVGFKIGREGGEQAVAPPGANIEDALVRFVSQEEVIDGGGERGLEKVAFHISVFFGKGAVQFIKRFSQIEACEIFLFSMYCSMTSVIYSLLFHAANGERSRPSRLHFIR